MTAPTPSGSTPIAPTSNVGGIVAMTAAMACFIVSDIFSKLATESMSAGEVIVVRGIFATLIFAIPATAYGYWRFVRTHMSKAWAVRIVGEMTAAITFIPALAHMPISSLTAITQTIPLVMTAAAALVLGEHVGIRRWTATGIGFLGVLLIMRPGTSDFSWWSIVALVTVLGVVIRDIATRKMIAGIPPILLTATTAAGVTVCGGILGLFESAWHWPTLRQTAYLFCAAASVAGGYYFSILAIQRASFSAVAPFRYTIIPMSVCAGYLIWGERPTLTTLAGITIVISAGLYTFLRERQLARMRAAPTAKA